jgi:hypothetical protein
VRRRNEADERQGQPLRVVRQNAVAVGLVGQTLVGGRVVGVVVVEQLKSMVKKTLFYSSVGRSQLICWENRR